MSMSIMIDKKYKKQHNENSNNFLTTPKLQPLIWIQDKKVDKCYECNISFSFLTRKHHCRLCGRIFCYDCCNQFCEVPEILHTITNQSLWFFESETQRTCNKCFTEVNIINDSKIELCTFLNLPLSIKELFQLRCISKKWCRIINFLILKYKRIQYFLSCQPISKMEKQFLWNHRFEYSNHPEMMILLAHHLHQFLIYQQLYF